MPLQTRLKPAATAAFVAFYLALLGWATWAHTFWRDESAVWLEARDNNLISMLHAVRYEGHPPLWYLVIHVITYFTWNTEWIKLPNLIATLASAAMILSVRNLALPARMAIILSYFMLFEYGLIDRNYMIGIAFIIAAALFARDSEADWKLSAALSCAALTSAPALIVAVCLYAYYILRHGWHARRLAPVCLFAVSVLIAAAVIYPPADSGSVLLRDKSPLVLRVENALRSIASAYLPIPGRRIQFWNLTLLSRGPDYLEPLVGALLAIPLAIFFLARRERTFFQATSIMLMALGMYTGRLALRHIGWLFIAFLVTQVLIAHDPDLEPHETAKRKGWRTAFLASLLTIQAATGLYATAVSLTHPFSSSLATVNYLRQQHLDQAPLVFSPGVVGTSILSYLQRPSAFYPERHRNGSYIVWDRQQLIGDHMPTPAEIAALSNGETLPVVLITEDPLTSNESTALHVQQLAAFQGAMAYNLPYIVYCRYPIQPRKP